MKYLLKYVILVMIIMFWLVFLFLCSDKAYSKPQIPFKVSVSGKVELGTDIKSYNTFLVIDLGLNIYFWKFKNYSYIGSRTWFVMDANNKKITGYPFREIYYYGNKLSIKGFFIDVQHFCNHAVKSDKIHKNTKKQFNDRWWSNIWGETMTTISIGYEFELPIYKNKYFK